MGLASATLTHLRDSTKQWRGRIGLPRDLDSMQLQPELTGAERRLALAVRRFITLAVAIARTAAANGAVDAGARRGDGRGRGRGKALRDGRFQRRGREPQHRVPLRRDELVSRAKASASARPPFR